MTIWERVDERGREHAANRGRTGDPATVSSGDGVTQQDIRDFSEDLYAVLIDKTEGEVN